jgi:GNAT superfamily N-acetyltransferase
MQIEHLQTKHRADWHMLWTGYLEFYETSVAPEVYDTTFARLIDPSHTAQNAFIAYDGDQALGLVHFIYHPHNWRIEDVCYLQDLFTVPQARGRGVARALIDAVAQDAKGRGAAAPYWLTQEFNHGARALYDKIATLTPFVKYQM